MHPNSPYHPPSPTLPVWSQKRKEFSLYNPSTLEVCQRSGSVKQPWLSGILHRIGALTRNLTPRLAPSLPCVSL